MKKYSARLGSLANTKHGQPDPTETLLQRLISGDGPKNIYVNTGHSTIGRRNCYRCAMCHGSIITVDEDDGVTPFMLGCRVRRSCRGMMQSSFYRDVPTRVPTYAWRRSGSGGDTLKLHELSVEEREVYGARLKGGAA